jgi:benzoate membrane transport protein
MIIGAENMQAIGILLSEGYGGEDHNDIPVNTMMLLSGLATMGAALFGGHAANIAGVKTALCATANHVPKEGRYVASLVEGVVFLAIGIFAPTMLSLVAILPGELLQVVTALALVPVLGSTFRIAWQGEFSLGSIFAFLFAASGITIYGIGAPLWSLIMGVGVAIITGEKKI